MAVHVNLGNALMFFQTFIVVMSVFATAWAIDRVARHIAQMPDWAKKRALDLPPDLPTPLELWLRNLRLLLVALVIMTMLATAYVMYWIENLH